MAFMEELRQILFTIHWSGSASDNWTATAQVLHEKRSQHKVKVGETRDKQRFYNELYARFDRKEGMIWCIVLVHMCD